MFGFNLAPMESAKSIGRWIAYATTDDKNIERSVKPKEPWSVKWFGQLPFLWFALLYTMRRPSTQGSVGTAQKTTVPSRVRHCNNKATVTNSSRYTL